MGFGNGEMMGDFGPLSTRFELVSQSKSPTASRWLVDYHFGKTLGSVTTVNSVQGLTL